MFNVGNALTGLFYAFFIAVASAVVLAICVFKELFD